MEKKVYPAWAFTNNSTEKCRINFAIYEELKAKYKIAWKCEISSEDYDKYDIIFSARRAGYSHMEYDIFKKPAELTDDEIALICDDGNLCFGYDKTPSGAYHIYID